MGKVATQGTNGKAIRKPIGPKPRPQPRPPQDPIVPVAEPRPLAATGRLGDQPRPNTMKVVLLLTDRQGEEKLYQLRPSGCGLLTDGTDEWTLENPSEDTVYRVRHAADGWSCSCPCGVNTPAIACKHQRALWALQRVTAMRIRRD